MSIIDELFNGNVSGVGCKIIDVEYRQKSAEVIALHKEIMASEMSDELRNKLNKYFALDDEVASKLEQIFFKKGFAIAMQFVIDSKKEVDE